MITGPGRGMEQAGLDLVQRHAPTGRAYLDSLAVHGIKLGLQNIAHLLARSANPERAYPSIHIAGTNGKGSVIALLHAMLQAAGYRVGRFTSPHLLDLRERFQINGECIPEEALEENIAWYRELALGLDFPPTFFEVNTAIALRWFAQEKVDLALVEVGLGGRLDSTNVLTPLAAAVTNIDLEHTEFLGNTLEKIAWEKAGIIKPRVPVVIGETKAGPRAVIVSQARDLEAPVRLLGNDFTYTVSGDPWRQRLSYQSPALHLDAVPLSLAGRHQGANAAVGIALAELCQQKFPRLCTEAIIEGLAAAQWPGRLEQVLAHPPVIMDVAHNVAGAERLKEMLPQAVVVCGVASDKDAAGMLRALSTFASPLILTQFSGKRALPAEALAAQCQGPRECIPDLAAALGRGLELAAPDKPLLITGSIYLAGEARQILIDRHGARSLAF